MNQYCRRRLKPMRLAREAAWKFGKLWKDRGFSHSNEARNGRIATLLSCGCNYPQSLLAIDIMPPFTQTENSTHSCTPQPEQCIRRWSYYYPWRSPKCTIGEHDSWLWDIGDSGGEGEGDLALVRYVASRSQIRYHSACASCIQ